MARFAQTLTNVQPKSTPVRLYHTYHVSTPSARFTVESVRQVSQTVSDRPWFTNNLPCSGYHGDGRSCTKRSACDGAPCHPTATCVDDQTSLNPGGYTCLCPAGENGCIQSNSTVCREGICMNGGTCKPLSDTQYRCACAEFYYGLHCEKVSACIGAPCANGGICENSGPGQVKCICPIGFYGPWCELEENSCGAHFAESVGNLTFPDNGEMPPEQQCDFVISTGEENSVGSCCKCGLKKPFQWMVLTKLDFKSRGLECRQSDLFSTVLENNGFPGANSQLRHKILKKVNRK
ncbi:EGF-like domain protein [Teladorsagia circumcincta]|uniref:EGF-like domain protein n=1 Tax=Teladorsagia circumcincta TaxID=45464 RepID=A0A2G9V4P1_TELCI|nr:EGF-like domain protein [Teladorsagia circumcincta]